MNIIKNFRVQKNISAKYMADALHISIEDYMYYEDHYDLIDTYLCMHMCDILKLDFNSI